MKPTRTPTRWLLHMAWVVAAMLALAAAGDRQVDAQARDAQKDVLVQTASPQRQTIKRRIAGSGTLQPYAEASIYSRIAGFVTEWRSDIGDRVKMGEVLARLSVPDVENEVKIKQAQITLAMIEVKQARDTQKIAKSRVATGEAKVQFAQASHIRAEAALRRWDEEYKRLKAAGEAVTRQMIDEVAGQLNSAKAELDVATANVAVAKATLQESNAELDKTESGVEVAEAKLQIARAELDRERERLAAATLTAPFDGVVVHRGVETGVYLAAPSWETASKRADAAFVIDRTDLLRAVVSVPETDALLVSRDAPATVHVPTFRGTDIAAKVTRTSWRLDDRSRTLRVEILIPNPKDELRPGMTASATILAELPDVLTLPVAAIYDDGERQYCYLLENGKAVRLNVKTGVAEKGVVEVLLKQSGPAEPWIKFMGTEPVIVSVSSRIKDGQSVREK